MLAVVLTQTCPGGPQREQEARALRHEQHDRRQAQVHRRHASSLSRKSLLARRALVLSGHHAVLSVHRLASTGVRIKAYFPHDSSVMALDLHSDAVRRPAMVGGLAGLTVVRHLSRRLSECASTWRTPWPPAPTTKRVGRQCLAGCVQRQPLTNTMLAEPDSLRRFSFAVCVDMHS